MRWAALLAGAAALGCSSSRPSVDTSIECAPQGYEFNVVQRMEMEECPIPQDGTPPNCNWFGFDDEVPNSETGLSLQPIAEGRCASTSALVLVSRRNTDWGAGFGEYDTVGDTGGENATGHDATGYDGVSFWARAIGHGTSTGFLFNVADRNSHVQGGICTEPVVDDAVAGQYTINEQGMVVPVGGDLPGPNDCGNNFSRVLEARRDWFLHLIPFESLQQQPLPNRQPGGIDRSAIFQFSLNIPKDSNIELWLDDLGFYRRTSGADAGVQP